MKKTIAIIAVVAVALVLLGMRTIFGKDTTLSASGTLEARNISVGSKVGGRVDKVLVQEGDHVKAGQVLVTFEDSELAARLLKAKGLYEQTKAAYEKMVHGSRPEDIQEARGTAAYQEHNSEVYRANVERARADESNAQRDYDRAVQLAHDGVVSKQFLDDAEARLKIARATRQSAEHSVVAQQGSISASEAVKQRAEHGNRKEDIAAAKAQMDAAEGDLKQAEAQWAERAVTAPTDAVVEALDIRPGDLLPANAVVAKLLEANQLFVVVYVPQGSIGKVKLGQSAEVRVDAFDKPFHAKVEQIRQQAEFIPRNVQTKEEREHQVIGVKLRVDNPDQTLRAGISADVKFLETK